MASPGSSLAALLPQDTVLELVEECPDCIKVLDREGQLLAINRGGQRALELRDPASWQRRLWVDLWPEPHRPAASGALAIARNGVQGHFRGLLPTSSGTPKYWDVTVLPLRDGQGVVDRLLVVSRDITAAWRLEQVAEREAIGHDVKTALTVVRAEAQLLERDIARAEPAGLAALRRRALAIVAAVDRLLPRIDDWTGRA